MIPSLRQLPPSRRNKKQIAAHLHGDLARKANAYKANKQLTSQEVIAMAVNAFAYRHGRSALLKVVRERLVRRKKSLAKEQSPESVAVSRAGKIRIAGWYDAKDVDQVRGYAIEMGLKVEAIVSQGLQIVLLEEDLPGAAAA